MANSSRPVLILGAGINGAALARELALNRVPVIVVDTSDICFGATAYSSRLIHGGLRYLEFGDFALVRESLAERSRLLRQAPQFVRPLRLHIPVEKRLGGFWQGARRFLFKGASKSGKTDRGLWLIRVGLWLYDRFARDPRLPRHSVQRVGTPGVPGVDPARYRWLCAYSDAQIRFVERFVIALLDDARSLCAAAGVEFQVLNYHRAEPRGARFDVGPVAGGPATLEGLEPAAVVNATGAWVDLTLGALKIATPKFMGGTKGSHFITFHAELRDSLADQALYAEFADGRPVFILPFGPAVLVGTTDIPFAERPDLALATDEELNYLVAGVNQVFPQVGLRRDDLELHYCGVRPLPASDAQTPAAVTRRHKIVEHTGAPWPLYSLVGGKLTTCRQLAEEAAAMILPRLGVARIADSRDRVVPGGEDYPDNEASLAEMQNRLAVEFGVSGQQVAAAWPLWGTRLRSVLTESNGPPWENVADTSLPVPLVRWMIAHEWVRALDDLVERRLMLLYHRPLTAACLRHLAQLLVEAGAVPRVDAVQQVEATTRRLQQHFGKRVE